MQKIPEKKARKLLENQIRIEVMKMDIPDNINAFTNGVKEGENLTKEERREQVLTQDERWFKVVNEYLSGEKVYEHSFEKNLRNIILYNRYYEEGILAGMQETDERNPALTRKGFMLLTFAIKDLVFENISVLSNKYRYNQVKMIEESGLLGEIALTFLKLQTYNICDNLKNEYGKKITRYCAINDTKIITKLIEIDYEDKIKNSYGNVINQMSVVELAYLYKKIKKGEKFTIWRGFAITKEQRVRRGLKADGDNAYYLQDAGTGLSYTMDKQVAYYFIHRALVGEGNILPSGNYSKAEKKWYLLTDKLIEGYTNVISQSRDNKKMHPILCKYECDPAKITGYSLGNNEAEVMIRPEDLKLVKYIMPKSYEIAEVFWEWTNRSNNTPEEINGAISNGLTAMTIYDPVREMECYSYAETERIRDDLEDLINLGKKATEADKRKLVEKVMENTILIPEAIDPVLWSKELFEYMKNPNLILREKGKIYFKDTNKIKKKIKKGLKKGF